VPDRGIGVCFRFGVSDGRAHPITYAYNVGIGAKGLLLWRPCDIFGMGWARTELSDHFVPLLRQRLRLGLVHEDAVELYDNAALTRWLGATLDLQSIEQALAKTLDGAGSPVRDLATAVVLGVRVSARFSSLRRDADAGPDAARWTRGRSPDLRERRRARRTGLCA
jgi:porin